MLAGWLLASSTAWCAGTTVFDTLGPTNIYSQNSGYTVSGPSSSIGTTFESAAEFVAQAGGALSGVDLGLTIRDGGPVNVYLAGDASGSPDNLSQILLGTVTPTQTFGTTNNTITTLFLLNDPSVTAGTTYWLVLKPGTDVTRDVWNQSLGISGVQDVSSDDSSWLQANTTLAAFRITAVPEVSPILAMALIAITTLFYGRSGFRFRRGN